METRKFTRSKGSVSSRIANRLHSVASIVSPRCPKSKNAAMLEMHFPTPVRHPHGLSLRLAGKSPVYHHPLLL